MCARRFLIAIFILTLLAVAGAVAVFQFGQGMLIRQAVPRGHFEAPPAGSGPDYTSAQGWIARPGMADDPSAWQPTEGSSGKESRAATAKRAHLFYVHPTTYLLRDRWNAPLAGHADSESRARLFVQSQASAFNHVAQVWAPRYRQAAFGAFLLDSPDAKKALQLAYADVAAAFDRFLAEIPQGAPIILAGHSQGALHLTRLLRERVAGKPIRQRIAAAYIVGWPISTVADIPALGLPACERPDQARCLLSWMSFAQPANPGLVLDSYEDSAGLAGGERRREDMLCVNPISGVRNGSATAFENPGTLVPTDSSMASAELVPGRLGASCDNGLLVIAGDLRELGPYVLPGNNYHVYDYALFWAAVRRDAARRLGAWAP